MNYRKESGGSSFSSEGETFFFNNYEISPCLPSKIILDGNDYEISPCLSSKIILDGRQGDIL